MHEVSDIELIKKCVSGDRFHQEVFYKKFASKMYNVCLAYSDSRDNAKDIMQDGFIKIFTSLNNYKGSGSLEGWVRKIMVNTALDFYRKMLKEKENRRIEDVHDFPVELSVLDSMEAYELMELVHRLPHGARLIFNLHVVEGYNHEEIAEMLDISTGTSKSQVCRAKSLLREWITKLTTKSILTESI